METELRMSFGRIAGELRRLSIAEEIVAGPTLLLIDEPTTGLPPEDEALLLRTFRELVNQDRTVVASMYQVMVQMQELSQQIAPASCGPNIIINLPFVVPRLNPPLAAVSACFQFVRHSAAAEQGPCHLLGSREGRRELFHQLPLWVLHGHLSKSSRLPHRHLWWVHPIQNCK